MTVKYAGKIDMSNGRESGCNFSGGGINLRPVLSVFDSFVTQPFFFCVKEDGA